MSGALCVVCTLLLVLLAVADRGPSQQCGWPYMAVGAPDFGPTTVEIAQHLLGASLGVNISATGKYDAAMAANVRLFQEANKLSTDGVLGPETWSALATRTTPIRAGSPAQAVLAVQTALTFNGFAVPWTGAFDAATQSALALFESSRGEPQHNLSVSEHTLHLLVTGCNGTGVFWFDFGWPQGSAPIETFSCLREHGFRFGTFECWIEGPGSEYVNGLFWPQCVQNVANAWAAGLESVGVYMFPQRIGDPVVQAQELMGNLSANSVVYSAVMLDIEGSKWSDYSHAENRVFIASLRETFNAAGVNVTVYCGREWPDFFGSTYEAFSDVPVIYAHYDNIPSYYDYYPSYGGWSKPAGKQFWDGANGESVCGVEMDWDWSATRFW